VPFQLFVLPEMAPHAPGKAAHPGADVDIIAPGEMEPAQPPDLKCAGGPDPDEKDVGSGAERAGDRGPDRPGGPPPFRAHLSRGRIFPSYGSS
jgi:hypothetical protein